jgi:4'-phosphopantetheinyl transferase
MACNLTPVYRRTMEDFPVLAQSEIHVWHRSLAASVSEHDALFALLDPNERLRAARLHFEADRDAFITSHGWLRTLLGRYLNADPRSLEFTFGNRGKPALQGTPLRFNLSHSGAMAACAVARNQEVGIDIEWIRPMSDLESVARRFFHPEECRKLLAMGEEDRVPAFFRCWTRKEAYIKALGDGLFAPLERFEVTLAQGEAPAFVQIDGRPSAAEWSLFGLDVGPDYTGAVAIRGTDWILRSPGPGG